MDMGHLAALTRSGLKDWFVQRISAIIILLYAIFAIIAVICVSHQANSDYSWAVLFSNMWVKVFTILAFISLIAHAWVGMWTIFTDYVKCAWASAFLQVTAIIGYLACFIWLICILF